MKQILLFSLLFVSTISFSQVGIGTTAPNSSAVLDLTSTTKGFLPPRLTQVQMNAIPTPANGLIVFCTDCTPTGIYSYNSPSWSALGGATAATVSVTCTGFAGNYCTGAGVSGTYVVTMTNNDFSAKQVTPLNTDLILSGVTGVVVASISPNTVQTINAGASLVITYTIANTPAAAGTLTGTWAKQGLTCSSTVAVVTAKAVTAASSSPALCISTPLTAITHTTSGATTGIGTPTGLPAGVTAAWASNTITISGTPTASGTFNYTIPVNGCGGTVNATGTITVNPALVAGAASATPTVPINVLMTNVTHSTTNVTSIGTPTGLPPGVTAAWAANTITISGTPTVLGTSAYTIPLVGVGACTANATGTITVSKSGAMVNGVFKEFMPFNLGANTALNPFTYVVGNADGSGGTLGWLYQWGRTTDGHQLRNSATQAGPVAAAVANRFITIPSGQSDWISPQSNTLWGDGTTGANPNKAVNDPCPTGFKVPSQAQWGGTFIGGTAGGAPGTATQNTWTWTGNGFKVGDLLYLPAAGYRTYFDAVNNSNSTYGFYWSSRVDNTQGYTLRFYQTAVEPGNSYGRASGQSVRCIAE